MKTRTKMICTIGPSVHSYEKICELIDVGMNGARLNFSHGTHEDHAKVIEKLKKARDEKQISLAIILDTKGPEVRVGLFKEEKIHLKDKQRILLTKEEVEGDETKIPINPGSVLENLEVGSRVLFDDGYIISHVVEKVKEGVIVELLNGGILKNRKGVNLPDTKVNLPALTDKDKEDLIFGCEHDVDVIAASFIRSAEHILEIKRFLVEHGGSNIQIIAKIESREGVDNFDAIVQVADGVMVARGDLGVEVPLEEVPALQKMMIRKCTMVNKPVITATQMLESMIQNPRPTRAEASDVANAIYDSTSCVMLSGETAMGKYPLEAATIMQKIIVEAEKEFSYRDFFLCCSRQEFRDVSTSVAYASAKTAYSCGAKALFVLTQSGLSAKMMSRFRPYMPIFALSPSKKVYHQLALNWGVISVLPRETYTAQEAFSYISAYALEKQYVRNGDLVVITAGTHFGISGATNMMFVENIGDVMVRGKPGPGTRIHGQILMVLAPDEISSKDNLSRRIAVISRCDHTYEPILERVCGVIMQNHPQDIESEKHLLQLAKRFNIPAIYRAEGALKVLSDELFVTLDPERGIVYKGKPQD
jgi:pyruvate kinase